MQPQALPGFRDFYPAELAFRAHIFATWREVAQRYGFEEYDGPPLEPLELYTAKSGDEIVGQLYSFTDKGDRQVALRPEMTPTLARMVAARAKGLRKPIRWFAIPQLFRYERQQRGRLREHFQFNCDLIGEAGPLADAEVIALAVDAMRAFGLGPGDVRVRLSDRRWFHRVCELRGLSEVQASVVMQVYDKLGRVPKDVSTAQLRAAGISEGNIGHLLGLASYKQFEQFRQGDRDTREAIESAQHLLATREALIQMGLGGFVDIDITVVRGLAYYTGTVFELFDAQGELRAICGGGRYDNLLHALGGVDLPAVGFGMGDVVLGELLRERELAPVAPAPVEVFVAGITEEDGPHVLRTAHLLRDAGLRAEFSLSAQVVGKQLKLADARQARFAVVIGPEERGRGEVMLKDLRLKGQRALRPEALVEELRRGLESGEHNDRTSRD